MIQEEESTQVGQSDQQTSYQQDIQSQQNQDHQQNEEIQQDVIIQEMPRYRPKKDIPDISDKISSLQCPVEKNFIIRYNPFKNLIALGSEDNLIRIYNYKNKNEPTYILKNDYQTKFASITDICWKPTRENQNFQNVLISSHSNGEILFWHATSNKILKRVQEGENVVYRIDYNQTGKYFATGGQDCQVRVYDENKTSVFTVLNESEDAPTHSNRIYALKFIDENVLLSAGWDKTILIWDIRCKRSQSFIYGPEICGDALDYNNNRILAGSFRDSDQIQIFDVRNNKKIKNINMNWEYGSESDQQFVYTAKFSQNGKKIVTGSAGYSQFSIFDENYNLSKELKINRSIYSIDFKDDNEFAFCGAQGLAGQFQT